MSDLPHDCCWDCASDLAALIAPLVPDEKRRTEFFCKAYTACKKLLLKYEILTSREAARLRPTPN
jgi:hypothetical protein